MKKLFCMILSVAMVLNLFLIPTKADAEQITITSITIPEYVFYERTNCYWADENGEIVFDKADRDFYLYYLNPDSYVVNLSDGSTLEPEGRTFEYGGETYALIEESNQTYANQWNAGEIHQFTVNVKKITGYDEQTGYTYEDTGVSTFVDVTIEATPVVSITVTEPVVFYEGIDGYLTSDYDYTTGDWGESYTVYSGYDIPVLITFQDGSTTPASTGGMAEYDGHSDYVIPSSDQSFDNQFSVGTNSFTVNFMGYETTIDVELKANPVESVTYDPISYYIGTNGSWIQDYDWDTDTYGDYYYGYYLYGTPVTINFKDDSIEPIETYVGDDEVEFNGQTYSVEFLDDQSVDNQWTIGINKATISVLGYECELDVEIKETPVASIEVEDLSTYEGDNGYLVDGVFYYDFSDAKKTITFKDGTVVETTDYYCEYEGEEYEIFTSSTQENEKAWDPETDRYTYVFMGVSTAKKANIIESPVQNIEIIKAECFEDTHSYYDDWYECTIYDVDNIVARIYFKDHTYTDTTEDGEFIYNGKKYNVVYTYTQDDENQWTVGNNPVSLYALGYTMDFDYAIAEHQEGQLSDIALESISVSQISGRTSYKLGEKLVLSGATLKLNYNSGTSREIMLTDDMVSGYDSEKAGTQTLTVSYGTKTTSFDVEVTVEQPTERIFAKEQTIRSSGETRYETAVATANNVKTALDVDKFDTIIVANGANFPDALSASYLSISKNAPILLVGNGDNPSGLDEVLSYIAANLTTGGRVYILGGTSAVAASVETRIMDVASRVIRISGADRYETNLKILETANAYESDVLLVASANGYADSTSASATGYPILIVDNTSDKLTAEQASFIKNGNFKKVYVLGGTAAVPAAIENEIKTLVPTKSEVKRLAGADRYETSIAIAKEFFAGATNLSVTTGANFADGLTGGLLSNVLGGPMILVNDSNVEQAENFAKTNSVTTLTVFGGNAAVSESISTRLENALTTSSGKPSNSGT